jgi:Fe2+ transport system protein FeoA
MPNVGAWLGANVLAGIEENRRINDPVATVLDVSKPPGVVYDLLPAPVFQVRLPAPEEAGEEDPVTATPARPRALLTGTTAVQVGSQRTELKIITSTSAWKAVLEDLGYDVDWRPVTPGEEVEDYAAVIVVLGKPNSIAASHFYGCLWTLLERDDAIIAVDDWQTQELLGGIQTYARSEERAFKLHGTKFSPEMREALFDGLKLMADEPWMWPVIANTLGKGDASLLGLPASVVQVDPTSYAFRYPAVPGKRKKGWVLASLLDRPAPEGVKWPVANYGRKENRVTEPELMKIYSEAWGVLSPPHAHAGSGWWRVRYLMAADAGCVISADIREAQGLGQPYVEASDPRYVERLSLPQLEDLARRQAECLKSIAWSKTKVKNAIRSLIAGAKDVAKPTPVTPGKRPAAAPTPLGQAGNVPDVESGEGSGKYMQRLLVLGFQAGDILAAVHRQFPGSKATVSDVSYNKGKLKQAGWVPGSAAPLPASQTARLPDKQPKYAVPASRGEEAPPWKENAADLSFATIRGKIATARRVGDKRTVQKFADAITAFLNELEGI